MQLTAGRHQLVLINDALKFREERIVDVAPGRTVTVQLEPIYGTLNINAQPWATVWVDGSTIGETPNRQLCATHRLSRSGAPASRAGRTAADRGGRRRAPHARRRGFEEMTVAVRLVLVVALALSPSGALAQDGVDRVRQLYVAADYDGALAELNRLPPATVAGSNWSATAIGR